MAAQAWPWELPAWSSFLVPRFPGWVTLGKSQHARALLSAPAGRGGAAPCLARQYTLVSAAHLEQAWPQWVPSSTLMSHKCGNGTRAPPGPASSGKRWSVTAQLESGKWRQEKEDTVDSLKILHVLLSCPQKGGLSRNREKKLSIRINQKKRGVGAGRNKTID